MKKTAPLAVIIAVLLTAPAAHAAGLSMFSGRTLGTDNTAINASVGMPNFSATYLWGKNSDTDMGFLLRLYYFSPIGQYDHTLWMVPGGAFRWHLKSYSSNTLGFRLDVGPLIMFPQGQGRGNELSGGSFNVGFLVAPAFVVGIPVRSEVIINAGFGIPFMMSFHDRIFAQIPLAITSGVEWLINPWFTLNFNLDLGPGIIAWSDSTQTDLYLLLKIGITFGL